MDDSRTIALLQRILSENPADWETRLHLADLLGGNSASTAAEILKAAPQPPSDAIALRKAAELLGRFDPATALTWLDTHLKTNKADAHAYLSKARILLAAGRRAEALKQYQVATIIDESLEAADLDAALKVSGNASPAAPPPQGSMPVSPSSPSGSDFDVSVDAADLATADAMLANRPPVSFADIGGMEELKEKIRVNIIYPFSKPEVFARFKKRAGGGLLFCGPPGCGKTLLARATAGECGAHFQELAIHDILSHWMGESEQRLHQVFETARRKTPAIIFIDEIDALGQKRGEAGGNIAMITNTLLTEIDGATSNNENVLVIGATNVPWRVDSAFRRPGRFDKVVFIPPPDAAARISILQILTGGLPVDAVDFSKLAQATEGFSGADLKLLVETATEKAILQELRSGKKEPIRQKDLLSAASETRKSTLEWFEQAANYASYANQAGLYDDLAAYLRARK